MKSLVDVYTLSNGVEIPCIGYGTWQMPNDATGVAGVKEAIRAGYRHIDTAIAYNNEVAVGQAIKDSGIAREDLFITSKLPNYVRGYEETLNAFEQSLKDLQIEVMDLFLIHWPNPLKYREQWEVMNAASWKAMEKLYEDGKIRAIGVSNFRPHHFEVLKKSAKIMPMVNQIRLCPGDEHEETVAYCKANNILLEAYSPLGTGQVLSDPKLKAISEKYDKSVAQVCLRWSLERGYLPLPKSVTPHRIQENGEIFDFKLSEEDVETIASMTGQFGLSRDPDQAEF